MFRPVGLYCSESRPKSQGFPSEGCSAAFSPFFTPLSFPPPPPPHTFRIKRWSRYVPLTKHAHSRIEDMEVSRTPPAAATTTHNLSTQHCDQVSLSCEHVHEPEACGLSDACTPTPSTQWLRSQRDARHLFPDQHEVRRQYPEGVLRGAMLPHDTTTFLRCEALFLTRAFSLCVTATRRHLSGEGLP